MVVGEYAGGQPSVWTQARQLLATEPSFLSSRISSVSLDLTEARQLRIERWQIN
jgi:hypothetical protein